MKIVFNKSSFEFDGLNVVLSVILLYAAFNNELSFNPFYLDSVWLKGIFDYSIYFIDTKRYSLSHSTEKDIQRKESK